LGPELQGSTLVLGGDGRYFNKPALSILMKMACANGVGKVIVGQNGIFATPALSCVIRKHKAFGGFILTASHNPGGPEEDWGIKYNCSNGGPAPESLTEAMYERTKTITEYKIVPHSAWPGEEELNIAKVGLYSVPTCVPGTTFTVEVVDSVIAYKELLWSLFDMPAIEKLFSHPKFRFAFDAMHAVTGPYAMQMFADALNADPSLLLNSVPREDFGGLHPDPNLKYAAQLVALMGCDEGGNPVSSSSSDMASGRLPPDIGFASDGDGDRNMVMGRGFFVSPSDSVAVIAANSDCIPYLSGGLKGVARSMPTSGALDIVAKAKGVECFVTPTGWKFFGNLMDAGRCSICGEESFGTGSDHVREKDGIWAVLAWLNILAAKNSESGPDDDLITVKEIVEAHWLRYGRNYYTRYDYEGVDSSGADAMMDHLRSNVLPSAVGQSFGPGMVIGKVMHSGCMPLRGGERVCAPPPAPRDPLPPPP